MSCKTATQLPEASSVQFADFAKPSHNRPRPLSGSDQIRTTTGGRRPESRMSHAKLRPPAAARQHSYGTALDDTPDTTAPSSPDIPPRRQNSFKDRSKRSAPTTLDIPGLTKSRVSPDGRIASRDVGSKLVIVMVGLPARGKSYVTKKVARYLNWLQHDTRIFNVGERRRVAAGVPGSMQIPDRSTTHHSAEMIRQSSTSTGVLNGIIDQQPKVDLPRLAAQILINGQNIVVPSDDECNLSHSTCNRQLQAHTDADTPPDIQLSEADQSALPPQLPTTQAMDQSASFFDPNNREAALIREQCALDALDELLDYILVQGGSVGILDATNSTLERRKLIVKHIREKAGQDLNILFLESVCMDENLLERNMRLKLSGPDYKDKDPEASLADFKKRVAIYEKNYVPLGDYEEKNNIPYVQMIDVGRKVISHQIKGFLSAQAVYYLLNFNLAPRQIWITRHGQSLDNMSGKLGGDSDLSDSGRRYAQVLARFICHERRAWEIHYLEKERAANLSPLSGDTTPPNPHYNSSDHADHITEKNFCVWTSMLKRSIQTAQYFDEDEFDVKQMRPLNELNAGDYEGMTYEDIKDTQSEEYERRREDKLHYRYPGPGGEGYLDVVNRLRPVIIELERMTDHCLLIAHRSVVRILLAYFRGLPRAEVADLNVPLGMLYCLEPKPYGVDFKAYQYNAEKQWFALQPNYQLHKISPHSEGVE